MYRWLLSLHGYYVIEGNCFNLSECTYTYRNYIFCSIWYRQSNQGEQWGTCLQQSSKCSGAMFSVTWKDYTGCLERASRNTSTIPTSGNKCGQSLQRHIKLLSDIGIGEMCTVWPCQLDECKLQCSIAALHPHTHIKHKWYMT